MRYGLPDRERQSGKRKIGKNGPVPECIWRSGKKGRALLMKAFIKYGWDLYKKYEEGINYLIFGFLAFVLNYALFFLFESILHLNYLIATVLSWVITVIFAYWTNRTFVFKSKNVSQGSLFKEFVSFIGARIATEFLEIGFMYLAVDILGMNSNIAKLIGQVLVIVSNYFLSKLWIFKKK